MTDQFFYQRIDAGKDSYAANKIYSGSDSDLFKTLRYLRTDSGVQFQTSVDFFQNNLDLFSNEKLDKADIQEYLRRNIFQPGILIGAIKENEDCLEFFHEFIQKAILYYSSTENNFDNVLYFYQLQADVDNYVLNMPECPEELKNNIRALQVIRLRDLQAIGVSAVKTESDKYRLSKIKLQLELNSTEKIEPKVLFDLLIDMCIAQRNIGIQSNEEREAYKKLMHLCIEKLKFNKAKIPQFALEWAKEQGLLKSYSLDRIAAWECKGSYPYFSYCDKSGKKMLSIDLTEGQILVEDTYLCFPPGELQNSNLYQEILGEQSLPRLMVTVLHKINGRMIENPSYLGPDDRVAEPTYRLQAKNKSEITTDLTPKIRTHHYEHRFANSNTSGAW